MFERVEIGQNAVLYRGEPAKDVLTTREGGL